ncbi:DUF1835 domain-containing protein [Rhizosphaericola mali]|uniref:DUF1835 domain-containing protein n=1 Tax=Rhizosphaericola mali TaxID=2545455 RepID=A0A5P2G6I1_9BACT|nr:DUF1835 domain-containing protein [Rhizosphaericola mali]QES89400.1 DUF1835 domain-containing protein [Rhizosphaericola mali]
MIHIVFEPSGAEVLKKSITLDESLDGEILVIKDDFAAGPVANIYDAEGFQARKAWWQSVLEFSPYTDQLDIVDDKMTVHQLKKKLEETEENVWIWMGQNPHDVCGYYWLISQLADYQGKIQVIYLNNLPFINEIGGIFYPQYLHEIQPKEFLKAKRLARPVTLSEFELDPDEWRKICREDEMVRILEGGKKIASKDVSFFDKDILDALGEKTVKLPRLLSSLLPKMSIKTGDAFLVWRIRELVNAGRILCDGSWEKGWKDIALKDTKGELFVEMDEEISE